MRNLKQTKRFFLILLMGVLIYSCSQDEQITPTAEIQQTENFVSLNEASGIASVIEYPLSSNSKDANLRKKGATSKFKEIEKILAVPDNNGNPSYYIVNYKDDGFIMISADNRTNPVRAYSLTEKFPMDSEKLPNGLLGWMTESSDMISQIRILDEEQTKSVAKSWKPCEIQKTIRRIEPDDDCGGNGGGGCENQYTTVGPLLTTEWGQWGVYNNLAPVLGCNNSDGRAPTGCVATAMAQVMKFHEHPNNYNWDDMPDSWGTMETARLMRDVADAVSMNWSCDGSGAKMNNAASAFSREFGYQNTSFSGFNSETVKQQLRWNRPVILSGYKEKSCFLWWCSYKQGHAWVCDGYRSTFYCETGTSYLYLHMNWGWGDSESYRRLNGWYAYNSWNPGNTSYNHKKEMIYNIKPQ